jgi:predicted ATPase
MSQPLSLSKVTIQGYKSINNLQSLELKALNVLIGANGSGKSNFISFFSMLSHIIDGRLQQYITRGGQASSFLYQGQRTTTSIMAKFSFGHESYFFELEPTVKGELMYTKEEISLVEGGKPIQLSTTGGYLESALPHSTTDEKLQKITKYMIKAIGEWKAYHFHDTSPTAPVKQRGEIQDNLYFRPDAANLAPFLFRLKRENPDHYAAIRDVVKLVAPFIHDFKLDPVTGNSTIINFSWTSVNSDFPFRIDQLSDGTLRFICLATLLLQPNLPATIIIDEPEIGLHPYAISILSSLLKKASSRTQVIIATQSVTLINEFDLEDLIVVECRDGESFFNRPDRAKLKDWLNEYSLGDLWEKSVLGGRSSS